MTKHQFPIPLFVMQKYIQDTLRNNLRSVAIRRLPGGGLSNRQRRHRRRLSPPGERPLVTCVLGEKLASFLRGVVNRAGWRTVGIDDLCAVAIQEPPVDERLQTPPSDAARFIARKTEPLNLRSIQDVIRTDGGENRKIPVGEHDRSSRG